MTIVGQFRDLDRPDHFVCLRGFDDMPGRARSLGAFYGGPAWKAHSHEANATMIDSEKSCCSGPCGSTPGSRRTASAGHRRAPRRLRRGSQSRRSSTRPASARRRPRRARPRRRLVVERRRRDDPRAVRHRTEHKHIPALPVRQGEHVYTVFAGFADAGGVRALPRRAGALRRLARARRGDRTAARAPARDAAAVADGPLAPVRSSPEGQWPGAGPWRRWRLAPRLRATARHRIPRWLAREQT